MHSLFACCVISVLESRRQITKNNEKQKRTERSERNSAVTHLDALLSGYVIDEEKEKKYYTTGNGRTSGGFW